MATLRTTVHLIDLNGRTHEFGPGDEIPSWAKKKITNAKAWDGGVPESSSDSSDELPATARKGSRGK
jgi:hypothetical protein